MPRLVRSTRAWVAARPRGQQVAGVAGLALAITAPFGGLAPADEDVAPLRADETFAVGPFDVRVTRVVSIADLAPAISPSEPGDRLLVVVAEVTNTDDVPRFATQLSEAFHAVGPGVVSTDGETGGETGGEAATPEIFVVADETQPSIFNPGVGYDLALVFEHSSDLDEEVTLAMQELTYVEEGALTLQNDFWLPGDRLTSRGEFEVEVKKAEVKE